MNNDSYSREFDLIKKNYCIGCGICTTSSFSNIFLDDYGKYNINLSGDIEEIDIIKILKNCPFSSLSQNEEILGKPLFDFTDIRKSDLIGYYLNNYIGYVKNEKLRLISSSGGIITWLLTSLLDNGNITHAVHVGKSKKKKLLFEYTISNNKEAIIAGAGSRYYPVEMSSVLKYIQENEGKYAIVALPCFTKGLRLLQKNNELFKHRIKYIIAPVCGHLKSTNYVYFLAWQKGIQPNRLNSVNFRKKISSKPASGYGTEFFYSNNNKKERAVVENSSYKMGTDWGHGMFKYIACDYCDDVVGELADISVGDAWLKKYIKDYKGNSVITIRNPYLDQHFYQGAHSDELHLEKVSPEVIKQSQAGGFRNKREDLAYRLWLKESKGEWHPPKRVTASAEVVNKKRIRLIKMRIKISQYSHELFNEALKRKKISFFYKKMTPLLNHYFLLNFGIIRFLKHKIKQML